MVSPERKHTHTHTNVNTLLCTRPHKFAGAADGEDERKGEVRGSQPRSDEADVKVQRLKQDSEMKSSASERDCRKS